VHRRSESVQPTATLQFVSLPIATDPTTGSSTQYLALGRALADSNRPLVYGGGTKGIMGVVSSTVLEGGGKVTGVVPYAIFAAGGEGEQNNKSETHVALNGASREGEQNKSDTHVAVNRASREGEQNKSDTHVAVNGASREGEQIKSGTHVALNGASRERVSVSRSNCEILS
jgi:hypothetical protein